MTLKEKVQRVLELHTWLKESKETSEAKAVWYAAEQAKAKYNMPFFEAYEYCLQSARFYDEVSAAADLVDALNRLRKW